MENLENKTKEQLLKEIDQLKTKVVALEKSELKNRIWLENSPVCTKIVDLDFNLQYMSSSGVKELKIDDITEFYGKPYPLHFYPDSFKIPMTKNLKKAKETGETITQEAPIVDIKGNTLWFHSTIVPVYNDKGQLDYLMVVSMEITELKQSVDALKENEEKLRIVFENSSLVHYSHSTEHVINYVSPQIEDILGYTQEEIVVNWTDLASNNPINELAFESTIKAIETGKKQPAYELEFIHKSGRKVLVEVNETPFVKDGKTISIVGSFSDITERKQADNILEQHKQNLANTIEGTNAGTWDWNIPSGECVFNERWAEIMGYSLEELMPVDINTWINNVHPDDLPMANSMLDKLFNKTLDYLDIVFRQPHKDGNWVWVNARGKVVDWSEEGKPLRISGTHLDITKQMQGQEELRKYREHLEETVKERTAEVDEKNKKLSDQMKVFVGRELKIKDLEMKIRAFEGESR